MEPQEKEHTPSFELPASKPENKSGVMPELHQVASTEKQSTKALEQGVAQAAPISQAPPIQASPQATAQDPVANATGWMPQIADDTDLIEKEWVIKAKEIVAGTAHDPHMQNKEVTKLKAEYMRRRYNKELKMSDD